MVGQGGGASASRDVSCEWRAGAFTFMLERNVKCVEEGLPSLDQSSRSILVLRRGERPGVVVQRHASGRAGPIPLPARSPRKPEPASRGLPSSDLIGGRDWVSAHRTDCEFSMTRLRSRLHGPHVRPHGRLAVSRRRTNQRSQATGCVTSPAPHCCHPPAHKRFRGCPGSYPTAKRTVLGTAMNRTSAAAYGAK